MVDKPYVGQVVKLSRSGFKSLKLDSREVFLQAERMVITEVNNVGTKDQPIWSIHVDQPLINMWMLNHTDVEAV